MIWGVLWSGVVVVWLMAMPSETRGRSWHYLLSMAPLVAVAMGLLLPASILRDSLALWMVSGLGVLAVVLIAWAWGGAIRNHGVMDICYPAAPVVAAGVMLWVGQKPLDGGMGLMLGLLAVWSIRLIVQTWGHNIRSERQPYAHWRKRFGRAWPLWSLFQIHLLQGVTVWLWCAPLAFALTAPGPIPWPLAWLGTVVWGAGFMLQWMADRQLAAFKANPENRGRLLDSGVWAWVRHPNYLGETIMWCAWLVFALAHPYGALTLFAPFFTGWFMGYASAAPFKEMHMARTRGEAWAAYCARTPRFLPRIGPHPR